MSRFSCGIKRKRDKETTVYGVSINEKAGKHYCFNRDYLVLPNKLTPLDIEEVKEKAVSVLNEPRGHGRFKPEIKDPEDWKTYYLFHSVPWYKNSLFYDKSYYVE